MTEETGKHPGGRPVKFKADYVRMARVACVDGGFTDLKLSRLFGVSKSTINRWKKDHPEFWDSIKKAKQEFDSSVVEKCFLQRCTGYAFTETTREPAMIGGENGQPLQSRMVVTKRVRKHVAPDAKGCMDWLCNRRPDRWKKVKHVEISGEEGGPVKTQGLVAVPSGPLTIAEWEKQVKEALENDKKAEKDALDTAANVRG